MSALHVRLVEAVGLPSNDFLGGFCDPFCKIYLKNVSNPEEAFRSQTQKKTTNPIFNAATSMYAHINSKYMISPYQPNIYSLVSPEDLSKGSLEIVLFDACASEAQLGWHSFSLSYFQKKQSFQGWLPIRYPDGNSSKTQPKEPPFQYIKGNISSLNTIEKMYMSLTKAQEYAQKLDKCVGFCVEGDTKKKPINNKEYLIHFKDSRVVQESSKWHTYLVPEEEEIPSTQPKFSQTTSEKIKSKIASTATSFLYSATKAAKQISEAVGKDVKQLLQHHGSRSRQSGRIYVIFEYQQQGKNMNTLLKITSKPLNIAPINAFSVTFNAGNCSLSDFNSSLSQWLPKNDDMDLYVLSFQELNETEVDSLEKGITVPEFKENENEKKDNIEIIECDNQQCALDNYLSDYLGEEYISVCHHKMWQTRLFIFAKRKYCNIISNVVSHFVATGVGGVGQNKGAVAISLDFDGVSLCFLSCHLAAHQTKVEERNKMWSKICSKTKVGWV